MAKINQNTIQQIKGINDATLTEELADSIPTKYTKKGTKPRHHKYPTKENEIAAKNYEDMIGLTRIKERKEKKALEMENRNKIDIIISKKAKERNQAKKEETQAVIEDFYAESR